MKKKNIYIIAGSNGAGKTTFARKFLPRYAKCSHFVNADLIALGLSPFSPEEAALSAGRLVLRQIQDYARLGMDFGFETTLAGKTYVNRLRKLKARGYQLHMFFLWIPDSELALSRIKERVFEGGHNIPEADVRRRFSRSIANFFALYKPLLSSWMIFNNDGVKPELIAEGKNGDVVVVHRELYDFIKSEASK